MILGCATRRYCKTRFIELSYNKGYYIRRQYDCCRSDGCTPPSTEMPPVNTTNNGKRCPVCYLDTGICSVKAMDCTGSATYCFEGFIKDKLRRPIKGCTTESSCNILKTYKKPLINKFRITDVTCFEPKIVTSCSSREVFLLALLPMKLFFFSAY
ncbi:protein RoBo-1-like [Thamnophis elegans]|uniref:protein RoBo-1-like n=1 Tax=Thamnophis elegans TaxID=35005 RepID=UPI00137766E6|nr:protein RoBo-1-like [Thamnophis elegans]